MKLSRTLAEKVVMAWYVAQGAMVHRAEASFRRIPTSGSCAACHRRFEKTFSVSHDLFGIFDGVSVFPQQPRVWWQVTTVAHQAAGPRGGTAPHFGNVSARKRKIADVAQVFSPPDVVLIFGASSVRDESDRRRFRHYFQVWAWQGQGWALQPFPLEVAVDAQDRPSIAPTARYAP